MTFEIGDKVKIVKFHHQELVHRLGTVDGFAQGMEDFIVVQVPGYEHEVTGGKWYFTEDEIEKTS